MYNIRYDKYVDLLTEIQYHLNYIGTIPLIGNSNISGDEIFKVIESANPINMGKKTKSKKLTMKDLQKAGIT